MKLPRVLLFLCGLLSTVYGRDGTQRYVNRTLSADEIERRVDELIGRMTLAEKLGQLQQLDGDWVGTYRPEHVEMAKAGLLGSTLNVRGAARTNQLQRYALEARLKIPVLLGFDVIHGYRTLFPIPLGETASWDLDAVE